MVSGAYGNFAETGFDSTSIVLPNLKSKKKHQRLKDISKQTSSNICSHLENPSCGQAVPGWVGEVGTAAAAAGPIPGRAREGGRPGAGHQAPEATTAAGPKVLKIPRDSKGVS